MLGREGLARIVAFWLGGRGIGSSYWTLVLAAHRGLLAAEELVSPPDMLLLEGARLVLRPSADGGGGFDKNGNKDSRFFLSFPTSTASEGPGDDTAMRFPTGLFGLRGGGLGGPVPLAVEFDRCDGFGERPVGLA